MQGNTEWKLSSFVFSEHATRVKDTGSFKGGGEEQRGKVSREAACKRTLAGMADAKN